MRMFFASHSAAVAGAEQSLLRLVQEAADCGHEGVVALPNRGPLAEHLDALAPSFRSVILPNRMWMGQRFNFVVGTIRLLQALGDVPRYVSALKSGHFDIAVVNTCVAPAPLVAAWVTRTPSLLLVRESLMSNPMLRSVLPRPLIRRLLAELADEVITVSKYVARQFRYSSVIIYPQISRHFFETPVDSCMSRPPGELHAVMLGTISREKGQLEAVEAIRVARDLGADVRLRIFGEGNFNAERAVELAIQRLGLHSFVTVERSTTNVLAAYRSADISIVCSRNEAFGKVTAESVLAGRPVVGYDCGGTSEILAYGGGITVKPTPEFLGEALFLLCQDGGSLRRLQDEARNSQIRGQVDATASAVLRCAERLGMAGRGGSQRSRHVANSEDR